MQCYLFHYILCISVIKQWLYNNLLFLNEQKKKEYILFGDKAAPDLGFLTAKLSNFRQGLIEHLSEHLSKDTIGARSFPWVRSPQHSPHLMFLNSEEVAAVGWWM
ncbi:hypothetical protein ATANTOWER_025367 [Ataeniobius toweri]|uniref:Uncharacterized protein n=1 Tax=Ataeniobius toweri TaxID=208326 RepID=A0ABU7A8U5_9TELE|nr:hypothetical protein [Ataeniobius toweri]